MTIDPKLVDLAVQEAPQIIDLLKTLFHRNNPNDPVPTNAQVIGAYQTALASSLAVDADWKAAHPETPAAPAEAPVDPPAAPADGQGTQ